MLRKVTLAVFTGALSLYSLSQGETYEATSKVNIQWGPEIKAKRTSTLSDIIGFDENNIYTFKSQRKGLLTMQMVMESYDHMLTLNQSQLMDLEMTGRDRTLEFALFLNNEMHLFSSHEDGKTKLNTLYHQTVDKATVTPNGDIRELANIDYSGHTRFNSGSYSYDLSRDSSKLLIYYNLPYERGDAEQFGFRVFSDKIEELWSKEVVLPYKDNLFEVMDYQVDNLGNVHLIGKLYNEVAKERRRGEANYTYQILSYSENGEKLNEYTIELEDRFITDMQIAVTDDHNIICAGFYSDKGSSSIKGSYFMKVDSNTKEILHTSYSEFGIDFITQNMTERQEKKTKKKEAKGKNVELYSYDLDDIIIRSDGGAMLIGEQYYWYTTTTTTTSANGGTQTTTVYHYIYNDIIAININPEGDIEWTEKIAKRQHTTNDNGFFSSYALSIVGDKLYFFFNDNPKNLEYTGSGKVYGMIGKKSVVTMVTLDSEGKQERESLFSMKDAEIMTRPKVCEQISPNEMILFGQRKKKQRFARITWK